MTWRKDWRSQPRGKSKKKKWFKVSDRLGISKGAKNFIEKKLNLGFNTKNLRSFNIQRATWGTRKYLGLCSTTKSGRRSSTRIKVATPRVGPGGYYIRHQGGKKGRRVDDKDKLTVFTAIHEAKHIDHHEGTSGTRQRNWESEADDVGFAALDEYCQLQQKKPAKKTTKNWRKAWRK